jgi:hypothetical protein
LATTTSAKRRFVGVGLGIGLLLALAVSPASGECAGPSVAFGGKSEHNVITVHPGDTVSLVGEFWTSDCFDTGPTGACERGPGDERPLTGIAVDVLQGQKPVVRVVEDADAKPDLTLSVSFEVPDVSPGGYRISVHSGGIEGSVYPELWLKVRAAPASA